MSDVEERIVQYGAWSVKEWKYDSNPPQADRPCTKTRSGASVCITDEGHLELYELEDYTSGVTVPAEVFSALMVAHAAYMSRKK